MSLKELLEKKQKNQLPRCYVCNVPLGESSNRLVVSKQWMHYSCAFGTSVHKNNLQQS